MKSFMKTILYAVISIAIIVSLCYVRGVYLPIEHTIDRSITLQASRAEIWSTLTDTAAYPGWLSGVKAIEPRSPENGDPCYTEIQSHGQAKVCIHIVTPQREFVATITDPAFHGTWTITLESINTANTRVTTTQHGFLPQPLYRFIGYQFGLDSEIKTFHEDLKKHLAH